MIFRFLLLFVFILINSCSSSIERERLDTEKKRLEIERERLDLEKSKYKNCNSCNSCSQTIKIDKVQSDCTSNCKEKVIISKTDDCKKISIQSIEDIWTLSINGDWYYAPDQIRSKTICEGDQKESFYKQYTNTESYVAETQVPATKKSSCINNILFDAKSKLYNLMIDRVLKDELSQTKLDATKREKVLTQLVDYNNAVKGRSFYYECKPTDPQKRWNQCICVLYASYSKGSKGLSELIQKLD